MPGKSRSSGGHSSGGSRGGGHSSGGHSSGGKGGSGGAGGPVQRNSAACPSFVGARVARLTRLNSCGAPLYGPESVATTRGIVTASFEPDVNEGKSLDTTNLNGELCVSGKTPSSLSGIKVTLEFCQVDPCVFSIFNPNFKIVRNSRDDYSGDIVGWRLSSNIQDSFGFALELWPKTMGMMGAACETDDDPDPSDPINVSGYFLLPLVIAQAPDKWELKGDEVVTFSLIGETRGGAAWDIGPYTVTRDETGDPSPLLRPIEDGSGKGRFRSPVTGQIDRSPDHFHAEIVSVTPPEPQCGCQPLIKPKLCVEQEGQTARVYLLNADEIAPIDPITGERDPVWVSFGDGSHRVNLTAPGNETSSCACQQDDEPEPPDPGRLRVEVTPDPNDPRKVTAKVVEWPDGVDAADVDWGADVAPDSGNVITQDKTNPRKVTAHLPHGANNADVDWGADAQPAGGDQNGPVAQDPNNPRRVTAHLPQGARQADVDWGADVQEQKGAA